MFHLFLLLSRKVWFLNAPVRKQFLHFLVRHFLFTDKLVARSDPDGKVSFWNSFIASEKEGLENGRGERME